MKKLARLWPNIYSYIKDKDVEKAKGTRNRKIKFEDYKNCLRASKIEKTWHKRLERREESHYNVDEWKKKLWMDIKNCENHNKGLKAKDIADL